MGVKWSCKNILVFVTCFLACLGTVGVNLAMIVIGAEQNQTTCEIDIIPVFLQVSGSVMMVFAVIHLFSIPIFLREMFREPERSSGGDLFGNSCGSIMSMFFLGFVG